jgi:hypothetical protein
MIESTRCLSARLRSSAIYSLYLAGEVRNPGWMMQVDKARLLAAVDVVAGSCRPKGPRRRSAEAVTLIVCEQGLSVRGGAAARDVAGIGFWASPVVVSAARLRSLVESLDGPEVDLGYSEGRLTVDWREMKAREQ